MQKGHQLQFDCMSCKDPVSFSLFTLEKTDGCIACSKCQKRYAFTDETLKRQLKKFEALCRQLIESEEILSNASIGIDVGENHVQIPYKLLLTRLNSNLELSIGNLPVTITFRIEPLKDMPIKE